MATANAEDFSDLHERVLRFMGAFSTTQFAIDNVIGLTGRVIDHRDRAALRGPARLTPRTQPPDPQLAGHRGIRTPVTQVDQLVEQGSGPQVRIISQALSAVRREHLERIQQAPRGADPSLASGEISPDGFAVSTQMPGDCGDRPTLAT